MHIKYIKYKKNTAAQYRKRNKNKIKQLGRQMQK